MVQAVAVLPVPSVGCELRVLSNLPAALHGCVAREALWFENPIVSGWGESRRCDVRRESPSSFSHTGVSGVRFAGPSREPVAGACPPSRRDSYRPAAAVSLCSDRQHRTLLFQDACSRTVVSNAGIIGWPVAHAGAWGRVGGDT